MRWTAMALLFSHTRFHGTTPREPWELGADAERVFRLFADLRYQLLPYLWWASRDAVSHSLPLARPLVLMDPEDPGTWRIDDAYGLGPHLVVAPLFNADGTRDFYLPEGRWVDWFHPDIVLEGRRWHHRAHVPFEEILLFQRTGTVIPLYAPGLETVPAVEAPPSRYRLALPGRDGFVAGASGLDLQMGSEGLSVRADSAAALEIPGRQPIPLEPGVWVAVRL